MFVTLLCLLQLSFGGPELPGSWLAETRFAGSTGRVLLEIHDEGDEHVAFVSLVSIRSSRIPMGPVKVLDSKVIVGQMELNWDSLTGDLIGFLPDSFVPVHKIAVRFKRLVSKDGLNSTSTSVTHLSKLPIWHFDSGAQIWSDPSSHEDFIFVGNDAGRLMAVKPHSGELLWETNLESAIRSKSTFSGAKLYVCTDDGQLHSLDWKDGSRLWSRQVSEPVFRVPFGSPGFRYDHQSSAVVVDKDGLLVGARDGTVYSLDLNGLTNWKFQAADLITGTPVVEKNLVLVTSFDGYIYALNRRTGKPIWKYDSGAAIPSSVAVSNDLLFVGSRSYDFMALDVKTGSIKWSQYFWFSWIESTPVVTDQQVYVGSSDAQLVSAFASESGSRLWQFEAQGSVWAKPRIVDNYLYIGTVGVANYLVDHEAYLYALDRNRGTCNWRFELPRPSDQAVWGFASAAANSQDMLVVAEIHGGVYGFEK